MPPVRPRAGAKRREDSAGSTCPLSPCSPAASLPLDPEAGGALLPAPPTWRAPPAGRGLPSETRARASRRGQARATPAPSSRCDFQDPQKSAPLAPWRLCSGFLGPDPLLRPRLQQRPEMQPLVSCHPVCRRPRTSREPPLAPAPSCKRLRLRHTHQPRPTRDQDHQRHCLPSPHLVPLEGAETHTELSSLMIITPCVHPERPT
ncbi:uncharacterized protein LOC126941226 [Macaca thibetana thibetana]|uniref:uncharacterized protein LOC126941226 n=1 Tax=Macaca thibetana thibetana TaxID=257877 RepID=UPI0021BC7F04|nr:uncharacterized protein LOC126941226 [Macaca thibetana thibetana]